MIKLIASDLDGTLLYGRDNTVSEEMFELIREMKRRGIIFAAASGRQYHNLKKLFAPVWQDMAFICENGAAVFYQDKIIAEQVVPKEQLLELVYNQTKHRTRHGLHMLHLLLIQFFLNRYPSS